MTSSTLPSPVKKAWRSSLKAIADLRLAIILLLLIALFSISGTVIEQGQSLSYYQSNYPEDPALFGFLTWKVLLLLGLDHVYRTPWFLSLLVFFGSSLTACTFTRQLPTLKAARTWKFRTQAAQFEKLALSAELDRGSLNSLIPLLEQYNYKVFHQGDALYARKGIIGRIGPIVVHAGILIVLAGGIWGAMTGFFAQEIVPSGETFRVQNIIDAGPWAGGQIPQDWGVKVNRFWIDYTPDGNIDQFYSDLSVVDEQGAELKHQTIAVNTPLRYDGVTFYQTDWGISGVKVQLNNSPVFRLPMAPLPALQGRFWGTWVPTKPDLSEGVSLLARDLQGILLTYDRQGQLMGAVRTGQGIELPNGITLKVVELIGSTGLQIKADPGVPIVYAGFGLLMVGVVMSYWSHSQVWALQKGDRFYLGAKTNRAQVAFEREVLQILEKVSEPLQGA